MTATMPDLRLQRAQALIPTVRKVDSGFRVASGSRDTEYLITQPNGHLVCTCPNFLHHQHESEYECKHILAVLAASEEGRLPTQDNLIQFPSAGSQIHIIHRYLSNEDPVRVKLIKNTKGYSWEISVAEPDPTAALATLRDIENRVRTEYGEPPDPSS
jgi:hypothetical protein